MLSNPVVGFNYASNEPVSFLQSAITALIGMVFLVGVLVFLFQFLAGGISFMTAGSDKANLEAAKIRMRNAILGLVVFFSVYMVIQVLEIFFGTNILSLDISSLFIGQ